jgi:hypothetical protein
VWNILQEYMKIAESTSEFLFVLCWTLQLLCCAKDPNQCDPVCGAITHFHSLSGCCCELPDWVMPRSILGEFRVTPLRAVLGLGGGWQSTSQQCADGPPAALSGCQRVLLRAHCASTCPKTRTHPLHGFAGTRCAKAFRVKMGTTSELTY